MTLSYFGRRTAFTLIELLIVIAIIGILVGLRPKLRCKAGNGPPGTRL